MDLGPLLDQKFIEAMKALGIKGCEVHNDLTWKEETKPSNRDPVEHILKHYNEYITGKIHNHLGNKKYHLVSIAYNAMMEFYWETAKEEVK